MSKPTNYYVTKRNLLIEIHKSKLSYSEFEDPRYHDYDIIVENLDDIFNPATQAEALSNHRIRLADNAYHAELGRFEDDDEAEIKPRLREYRQQFSSFVPDQLVYRVYTYEHIPLAPRRKRNPKADADRYAKLNFRPFKHYVIESNGQAREVGRSHSLNGEFSITHGALTNRLAEMCMQMVERYSYRPNWRRYSYLDEMKGQSLLQLSDVALKFDEFNTDNPFGYYTRILQNTFTRVWNQEKKVQRAKDEILISRGQSPSFGRQIQHEQEQRVNRENED